MNDIYRHKPTGNLYEKLCDSIITDTKQSVVVYCDVKERKIYVRDTEIFNERFEKAE